MKVSNLTSVIQRHIVILLIGMGTQKIYFKVLLTRASNHGEKSSVPLKYTVAVYNCMP